MKQLKDGLRVGLIGAGHIAGTHVAAWRKSALGEVVCIVDVNREIAVRFANRHRILAVVESAAELASQVDIIDDCSPPSAHFQNALIALGGGCHYLVEKPIVLTGAELDEILALQVEVGRHLCVVHNLKYHPGVKMAMRWTREGRIGEVLGLERHFLTDPHADRMLRQPNHWSQGLPGGRWVETLPHELYLTFHFLGPLDVESITALRTGRSTDGKTADEVLITLCSGSVLAAIRYSSRSAANRRTLVVYGSEGMIRVDVLGGSAVLLGARDSGWVRAVGRDTLDALAVLARMPVDRLSSVTSRLRGQTSHAELIAAFARAVRGDGPPPVSLEEIAYVVRTTERIGVGISAQLGPNS